MSQPFSGRVGFKFLPILGNEKKIITRGFRISEAYFILNQNFGSACIIMQIHIPVRIKLNLDPNPNVGGKKVSKNNFKMLGANAHPPWRSGFKRFLIMRIHGDPDLKHIIICRSAVIL